MSDKLDLSGVRVEKADTSKRSIHFHYFLDMKRRLDGVFYLSNSHVVFHFEKHRVLMEVIDSELQGMCLFCILAQEYSYSNNSDAVGPVSISMDAWRIMSETSKSKTSRKRDLLLRIELFSEAQCKFGVVNVESGEFSYVMEDSRFALSVYKTNRLLEPTRWNTRATLLCPMEFDRICKETCAFHDILKLECGPGELYLYTDRRTNIKYTIPEEVGLMALDIQKKENGSTYDLPLRILRVITKFCTKVDRIIIYTGRPVTFVAKRKKQIIWTLRLK